MSAFSFESIDSLFAGWRGQVSNLFLDDLSKIQTFID
ncbi:hypothetical protein SAMN04488128_1024 [Chitinophaga eiseniae]|uniref:Uncharacterized protein n=1 Tax=Chitinophaga eiseniae TaxID=634771 RepID=A0A1T4PU40_9BACT|nr:hypothetical protein SAMN04488128_1024 [Chitinophaga eiseniae]